LVDRMPDTAFPLISVIVPAYNAAATLQQALDSVWAQHYPRLELLLVDDGSTDATLALVQQARAAGHPVRLWQQARQGPASARNLALQHAQGELIAFLDADDVWLPGKLQAQVAYLQAHPEVDVVFGPFERWEAQPDGQFVKPPTSAISASTAPPAGLPRLAQPSGSLYADLLLDSVVHIITALVRREVFLRVGGFDASLRTGSDYDFWLRASRYCRIDQLDQTVAWYRIHPASITKQPRRHNAEYLLVQKALRIHGPTGPDGRCVLASALQQRLFGISFGHGYLHFWHGVPWYACLAFAQALQHRPWHGKTWAYLALSLLRVPPAWVVQKCQAFMQR